MSIATNNLSETSRAAAWPEFLRSAGSPRARAHLEARLTRIQKAHRAGNWRQLRYLTQQYLTSYDARLAATRLASRKMRWDRRPKKTQLRSIAENLNAFQGTREEVRLILIPKGPDKFRPTLEFGIENRALQYLVLSVLYAVSELHPRQFATRGGVPAAIAKVAKAMKAGNVHASEIDIKDFYASFDGNKLVELVPVQKRVIMRVMLSEHLAILPGKSLHHTTASCIGPADTDQGELAPLEKYLADARRGIPQGSAASPILAEMLLAPLLFQVPTGGEVVAYADNILVMTKTESVAVAMTESLGIALKKHPAGQLWPKINCFPPGGPIEFLGHRLTAHDDDLRIQPTAQNRDKFERKTKRGLARLKKSTLSPAARGRMLRELKSDLSSHAANFRLCDDMKKYREYWSARIASANHEGSTMPQSKQASTKRMVFWPHPDQAVIITAALDLAKKEVPTEFQTVALEAIAVSFMATGIAFKDWRQALRFARKYTQDPAALAHQALTLVEELCPELVIEATITVKGADHESETQTT